MFNPYIVVPFAVWAITQFLKFIIFAAKGRLDFKYLYASGGMPSVHAAVVTSLATTAFLLEGPESPIFGLTVILAGIVMYDSFGVRRSAGEQAIAINLIFESLNKDRIPLTHPQQHLREVLGHKPSEVAVGATLGLCLAGLFNIDRLGSLFIFLSTPVPQWVTFALAAAGAIAVVGGFMARQIALKRYGAIVTVNNAVKKMYVWLASYGLASALLAFLQYEKIQISSWLFWASLLQVLLVAIVLWFIRLYKAPIMNAVIEYKIHQDKQKWLEGPNKERRKAKAKKRR